MTASAAGREALPARAKHGARAPVQDAAAAWVASALASIREGCVVVIDYGSTTAQLAHRPYREWLRTYRRNERGEHYLRSPGTQDITADVAVDQLPASSIGDDPGRVAAHGGGSTSSSRTESGSGASARRPPTSPRCGCGAGSARRKRCSTSAVSAPSWSSSGSCRIRCFKSGPELTMKSRQTPQGVGDASGGRILH